MSFLTLGIFWVGQQTQLNHLTRSNRHLSWIHVAFFVCRHPDAVFHDTLLADFIRYRMALLVYWGNILLLGVVLYSSWGYAIRAGLVKDDIPPEVPAAICRRILLAQSLYAFGRCSRYSPHTGASGSSFWCSSTTRLRPGFAGCLVSDWRKGCPTGTPQRRPSPLITALSRPGLSSVWPLTSGTRLYPVRGDGSSPGHRREPPGLERGGCESAPAAAPSRSTSHWLGPSG